MWVTNAMSMKLLHEKQHDWKKKKKKKKKERERRKKKPKLPKGRK